MCLICVYLFVYVYVTQLGRNIPTSLRPLTSMPRSLYSYFKEAAISACVGGIV